MSWVDTRIIKIFCNLSNLSCYDLYRALFFVHLLKGPQYNNIVKTKHILDYLDSQTFRKNIQNSLNRGEGYHRLRKNIFYAHEGKFHVHSVAEQRIWSDCARLIANAMIYYNIYLLSQLFESKKHNGTEQELEFIKKMSPIAWRRAHCMIIS